MLSCASQPATTPATAATRIQVVSFLNTSLPDLRVLPRRCGAGVDDRPARGSPASAQNITRASASPVITATAVATRPGIMNEWLSTYLPIFVVPDRSKLIAAISEP